MINREITKENLDNLYSEGFDIDRFKAVDPCGVVYKLMEHTDRQLDIELGALFTALITWGSRKVIWPTALNMMEKEMKWHPADFIINEEYENCYVDAKNGCVYRTLNVSTFKNVCRKVRKAVNGYSTIEEMIKGKSAFEAIRVLCDMLSDAKAGTLGKSPCKRVCMYLRWMTRHASPDLNIWKSRSQADLYAVMDVHVCQLTNTILKNKRPTWKACEELTSIFKSWDANDPLKYDIALMTLADRIEQEEKQ